MSELTAERATARSRGVDNTAAFLGGIPLFQDIPSHDLKFLARLVDHVTFPAGAIVFEKDSLTSELAIIAQGSVAILMPGATENIELVRLGPGSYFGEMAIFDDYPRSATAQAVTDVSLCMITKDAFRSFVRFHPATLFQMCRVFSHRIRNTNSLLAKR